MQSQLTEEDIEFLECLEDPTAATEIIFSDLDKLGRFDEKTFARIRNAQIPMQSYEYTVRDNFPEDEKNRLMEETGSGYCLGGRGYGKSLCFLIVDECLSLINHIGWEMGLSSCDETAIYRVQDKVVQAMSHNPFLRLFYSHKSKQNNYTVYGKEGTLIESINMKLKSSRKDDAGSNWFGYHHKKVWVEEGSTETDEVYSKRIDAKDLKVYIERVSGMTNFTRHTPAGRVFNNPDLNHLVINLPQMCNPDFKLKDMKEAIRKHHGRHSIFFKMFVLGEVCTEGEQALDMERVDKCWMRDKSVTFIEISKEDFNRYGPGTLNLLVPVSRPNWAERIWIAGDIGHSAPTEITVYAEHKGKYRLLYDIVTHKLDEKEDYLIFKQLMTSLNAEFTGMDTTDGKGRGIYQRALEDFKPENLVAVGFNEKLETYPKQENGEFIYDNNGNLVMEEEYVIMWAFQRAQHLLYNQLMELPYDAKLDEQFDKVTVVNKTRQIPQCLASEDHMWQSFNVFCIMQWHNELKVIKGVGPTKRTWIV